MSFVLVQAFPEFILQGKHFCHSVGRPVFADEEVSALDMMYGHTSHPQPMEHFMKKVCLPADQRSSWSVRDTYLKIQLM